MSDDVEDVAKEEALEPRDVHDGATIEPPSKIGTNVLGLMSQIMNFNGMTNLSHPALEEVLTIMKKKFIP